MVGRERDPAAPRKNVRSGNKPFPNHEKLKAINKVYNGESKAAVARNMGVPESTLRGWCKNEQKIKMQVQQEEQTAANSSDASRSSLDSGSNSAESPLLRSPPLGQVNFSNAPQPSSSAKTPGLYTPLRQEIQNDPKTPQNLSLRAEIPGSNGRNKAELHRIGASMSNTPAAAPMFDSYNIHHLSRLLQENAAVANVSKKLKNQAQAGGIISEQPNIGLEIMLYAALRAQQQQHGLLQQQQYSHPSATIQQLQQPNGMYSTTGYPLGSSSKSSSRENLKRKRSSEPSASTSLPAPLNGNFSVADVQRNQSGPFAPYASTAVRNQSELNTTLGYNLTSERAQPSLVNGHSRISPVPNHLDLLLSQTGVRPSYQSIQNVPQHYPQNLNWKKSLSPSPCRSPASSVSSHHGVIDFSNHGSPSPNNQRDSNDSSPNAASPAPGHYSPALNLSAATEATALPSETRPAAAVGTTANSEGTLKKVVGNGSIAKSFPGFKTHLGRPIDEIKDPKEVVLCGKKFYNFLNKFGTNPTINEKFLGQLKEAIYACESQHNGNEMDQFGAVHAVDNQLDGNQMDSSE